MRALVSSLLVGLVSTSAFVLAACGGDDDATRPSFEADAGTPDAAPVSNRDPFDPTPATVECAVTPCMTKLVGAATHYCALSSEGKVYCWGNPTAIGSVAGGDGTVPVVLADADVVDLGVSEDRTCVVRTDGSVECVGRDSPTLARIDAVSNVQQLSIGSERACAVDREGVLSCWGDSAAIGKGTGPVALGDDKASSATLNGPVAFALDTTGKLFSWGADQNMLGRDTPLAADWTPMPVQGLGAVLQVATSDVHVCAIALAGGLYCWGNGSEGGLGLGSMLSTPTPTEIPTKGSAWPAQVSASFTHSCARMTDDSIFCWGRTNTGGELGYGDAKGVYVPTQVQGVAGVAVATGTGSTCVLARNGSVQCFGGNVYGQLALGQRDAQRHPVPATVSFP